LTDSIFNYFGKKRIKVLDFGCGQGLFSSTLSKEQNIKYIGIDKDFSLISIAKKKYPLLSYIVSNEELCFKNQQLDLVLANNVLHHMTEQQITTFAGSLKNILKEKGMLIIIELVPRNQQKGLLFKGVTFLEEKIKKIIYYKKEDLARILGSEFKNIQTETISLNFIKYLYTFESSK